MGVFKLKQYYPTKEDNAKIYQWTTAQRTFRTANKLKQNRINKLDEINFIWNQQDESWNDKYQKLIDWKGINPDPLKWPSQRSKEAVEHELAVWFLRLRSDYKKGNIKEDRFNKLLEISFPFEPHLDKWMILYEELREFINKNGRFPSLVLDKKGAKFYNWLKKQFSQLSQLSKNQQKLLEEINYQDFENQFTNWPKSYDILVDFIERNKRLPSPGNGKEEINIYSWLTRQKISFNKNLLKKDQIDLLFIMEDVKNYLQLPAGERRAKFPIKSLARYEELVEFRKNNSERWPSGTSDNEKEKSLAAWLGYIKCWHRGGIEGFKEFPKELFDKLSKIGFDLSVSTLRKRIDWPDNYDKALEIMKKGDVLDKISYTWFNNQKASLRKGKLNLDKKQKIELLESLRIKNKGSRQLQRGNSLNIFNIIA